MNQYTCRRFAMQCVEWASEIADPSHHLGFTSTARQWLNVAQEIERKPESAHAAIRAKLH